MTRTWRKGILWTAVAGVLAWGTWRAFQPTPVLVDSTVVGRGSLTVTVADDGRTRVRERYTISAPIAGRLLRTRLKAGDVVRARESVLAEFEPVAPHLLDARARAEAEVRVERARAALELAKAQAAQAEADAQFADAELNRRRELSNSGSESPRELDRAQRDARRAGEGLRAAQFAVNVARHELELNEASLLDGEPGADDRVRHLVSPIDGRVLRVFEESARAVTVGTPILEVGDTGTLEVVADFLSQDAVKVRPGMTVLVDGWGGVSADGHDVTLRGKVRVIEPAAVTKVSALGVEEQRVDIVVDPIDDPEQWSTLGDGYRVELRIVIHEEADVLLVPTGALFREGDAWMVYVVEDERARRRTLTLGRHNGLEAMVIDGLRGGERVILYPSDLLRDDTLVEAR